MNKNGFLIFIAVFVVLSMFLVSGGSYSGKLSVSSSGGKIIISGQGQLPQHYCGNGILESYLGEQCDGQDLGSASCVSKGYDSGILSCTSNCLLDTSRCSVTQTTTTSGGGGGGGGGSSSLLSTSNSNCVESWQCPDWGVCKNGKQTRTCYDANNCGTTDLKPLLERECSVEGASGEAGIGLNNAGNAGITGGAIGVLGTTGTVVLIFVVIIGVLALIVFSRGKKGKRRRYYKGK